MARHTQRNIAFVIFGVVIVGAMVFLFFTEGGKFSGGEIFPLALVGENFGIDCRAWNQMSERGINGVTRTFSVVTVNFDVFTTFELVSTSSSVGNLDLIDTSMRVACDPVFVSDLTFDMVGGTTITRFYATQENGQEILIKSVTRNITTIPRDVLNRDLIIPTGTIRASEIDDKLTSTVENYITRVRTTITADLLFKGSATGDLLNTGTAVVQGILTVKVHNEIVNPPQPVSNFVDLTSVTGGMAGSETIDLANEFSTVVIKVKGELPQWSESEGLPFYDVFTPSGNKFASGIRMTVVTLIDSTTNTFEFIDPSFAIGTSPQLGFWQVTMHSNQDIRRSDIGLSSTDTKVFKVINTKPEGVTCPDGTVVSSIEQCPLPPPPLLDSDGDGIPDVDDLCPFEIGFARNNGCPEPVDCPTGQTLIDGVCVPKPSEGNLIEKVLEGDIVTLTTVRFDDRTTETAIASTSGASIQLPNLIQQISELVPAILIGTIQEGEGKPIDQISIEIFYINNVNPELIGVRSSMLELILTVEESTVSIASSNPIPFTGGIGDGKLSPLSGDVGLLGTGISLGTVRVTAENIVNLGEEAEIKSGQKKDADLIFSISGFVTFNDGDERERFLLTNSFIIIQDVDIDNVAPPVADPKCLDTQLEVINPQTGKITCITPPPDTPTCFSNERPQGFACTPNDIIQFCGGDPNNCTEKDLDNDGVPDHRDECRDRTNPDLLEDGLTINNSDPDDGCKANKQEIRCNPLVKDCNPEPPVPPVPPFCSETNPDACILPPEQFTLLLIVVAVILIVIGIAVALSRRRAKVFG